MSQANSAHSGQPGQTSAATSDLFVYGTLVIDQVIRALIDRVPTHEPVIAQGWRVAQLPDRLYPGLVPDRCQAPGRLYTDLTTREWATLDAFEDPTYALTTLEVLPGPRPALAYIWPDEHVSGTLDRQQLERNRSHSLRRTMRSLAPALRTEADAHPIRLRPVRLTAQRGPAHRPGSSCGG
ncbi:MAG: gamma-glutamylcyclotransferase family protein [Pseudonocardiaceae bacterium]